MCPCSWESHGVKDGTELYQAYSPSWYHINYCIHSTNETQGFSRDPPLGTTDWAQAFCCGGGLCLVGCSATPLPSAHEMPGDPIRSCDNSKCSKTLPHVPCVCECVSVKPPWLRTTVLKVRDSSIETLVQATCRVVICVLTLAFLIWETEVI